jgi:CheY-like chemotaxis protein
MRKQLSPSNSQAVSGKEAFNTLLASYQLADPYDIVIIDQRLNDIDPFQLAQTIRQHKALYQPMLALLTNDGSVNTKESAKAAGFFECIVKPIQPLALQIVLTAAWERWSEQKGNVCPS